MLIDDRDIRVVKLREMKRKVEVTGPHHLADGFEAGLDLSAFPTGNGGLGLTEAGPKLRLRQAGAQPSLSNQVSTNHGDKCSTNMLYRCPDVETHPPEGRTWA